MTETNAMTGRAHTHLHVRSEPGGVRGDDVVAALEEASERSRELARASAALLAHGWEIALSPVLDLAVHAELEADYFSAVRSAEAALAPGQTVDWFAGPLALGGFIVGRDALAFGPGDPLPLIVHNVLTGRQARVEEEHELRAAVVQAIEDCADWWEAHPEQAPDGDAAAIAAAIRAEADAVGPADAAIPAHWRHHVEAGLLGPSTAVALTTEAHLRWEGAKSVLELAEHELWPVEQLADEALVLDHGVHSGLMRVPFAAGARDAVALLRD